MAKLTMAKAEAIRRRHAEGHGVREIAREVGMDPGSISRLLRDQTWRGTKMERIARLEAENAKLREVVKWARRLDDSIRHLDGDGIVPDISLDDTARALASLDRTLAEWEAVDRRAGAVLG